MNFRWIIASLMFFGLVLAARADDLKCDICGKTIDADYYTTLTDYVTGGKKTVCKECSELPEHCFACGLPVKTDFKTLSDGRFLCARDAHDAIGSDDDARRVCENVRDDIDRMYSRFLILPETNVVLSIVDRFTLENLFHSPGYEKACVTVFGATQTHAVGGGIIHSISILSNLRQSRLSAVCAHEYSHTWIGENVKPTRKAALDPDTVEGFCELIAYKYMESRGETIELESIKNNPYTKGQIGVMIEAESQYGINAVLEWMKSGEDTKLDPANLDRIRSLQNPVAAPAAALAALLVVHHTAPSPVPDTLMLKGISGSGQHRFALINNATLEPMERAKVRVGQTNVSVRCLEIRDKSVLIQLNNSDEKQELFLRPDK